MAFDKDTLISVLNYNKGSIFLPTPSGVNGYVFDPMTNDIPFEVLIPFSDIKYVNGRSSIFKDGILKFDKELEEEIFKELGIRLRTNEVILSDAEMEDIILNPTSEKLTKVTKVTSIMILEKLRNKLTELDNSDEYDISVRVFEVINGRYIELNNGKKMTDIDIKQKKNEPKKPGRPPKNKENEE